MRAASRTWMIRSAFGTPFCFSAKPMFSATVSWGYRA